MVWEDGGVWGIGDSERERERERARRGRRASGYFTVLRKIRKILLAV